MGGWQGTVLGDLQGWASDSERDKDPRQGSEQRLTLPDLDYSDTCCAGARSPPLPCLTVLCLLPQDQPGASMGA